jgi:hypothetical protein
VVAHPEGRGPFSMSIPFIFLSEEAFFMLSRISFNPAIGDRHIYNISQQRILLPLSGMGMPVFRTSIEFSGTEAGFSPEATIALKPDIKITKKSMEASIIPVIVASV